MRHSRKPKHNYVKSDLLRYLLIAVGWISIALGIVGLFLPLIPTVPFLLLAAVCFSRSSLRFHTWLVEHRQFGPLLRDFLSTGSIPMKTKVIALGMVWISFPASSFLFVEVLWLKVLLLSAAAAVTLYLLSLPTTPPAAKADDSQNDG